MEAPAVMFLEMHRPLSFVGSQALIVGSPFLGPFVGIEKVQVISTPAALAQRAGSR